MQLPIPWGYFIEPTITISANEFDYEEIDRKKLLYVQVCRKCYARNALRAKKCRKCGSTRLRLKNRDTKG